MSQEKRFSQIWDLCRNTANHINFHYRANSVENNNQIFQKIKKPFLAHFGSIFPILQQEKFSQKIQLCHAQLHMGF